MKNKRTLNVPDGITITRHKVGTVERLTYPSIDENGNMLQKLVAIVRNDELLWVCNGFYV